MDNSTVRRGLVVVVLITCSMLLLWWLVPSASDNEPSATPSATLSS